jgi:hypothetical protein
MLRETRNGDSREGCLCLTLNVGPNLEKRHIMEIIKGAHDLALVLVLIAICMAPQAIATYLAL